MKPDDTLIASWCCNDACNAVNIENNGNVNQARDIVEPLTIEAPEVDTAKRSSLSNAARAAEIVNKRDIIEDSVVKRGDTPQVKCTVKDKMGPMLTAGQQRAVTQPEQCNNGPSCAHTVSVTTEASTALSNSKTSTWTLTGGYSVSCTPIALLIALPETSLPIALCFMVACQPCINHVRHTKLIHFP